MSYKYTLGKKLKNGLYELYRNGEKTEVKIKSLDIINSNSIYKDNGWIYGGRIFGDEILGGVIKNPLQIQGTRHYMIYNEIDREPAISIGCECRTIKEWLENYEEIGKANGYTHDQIIEYCGHIRYFANYYGVEVRIWQGKN